MPITHRSVRYNCRIWIYGGCIIGIRPKICLANEGVYRETRWFTPWSHSTLSSNYTPLKRSTLEIEFPSFFIDKSALYEKDGSYIKAILKPILLPDDIDKYLLPSFVTKNLPYKQTMVPFGVFVIDTPNFCIATEACEELFTTNAPHSKLYLCGVDIITNGSGSHHNLRKIKQRFDLIRSATSKSSGIYVYCNQIGCDGNRLYYDGGSCISVCGQLVSQASQFGIMDVETIASTIDIDSIRTLRSSSSSRSFQSTGLQYVPNIFVNVASGDNDPFILRYKNCFERISF